MPKTERQPRSDTEAKFISLQEKSDTYGLIIANITSWELEDPILRDNKLKFISLLGEARQLILQTFGESNKDIAIKARYLYDYHPGKKGSQRWTLVLPLRSLFYIAVIKGRLVGIDPILATNPETKKRGWRICTIVNAYNVLGYRVSSDSIAGINVAVPLSQILTEPIGEDEYDDICLDLP